MCKVIAIALCFAFFWFSADAEIRDWTNLRVTYGFNPITNFNAMPRTAREAEANGWKMIGAKTCDNFGKYNGYRYIYGDDVGLALLYDINGIIAGIQMNLLKKEILTPNNEFKYNRVPMFQDGIIRGHEVYTLTAYFVEPSTICTRGRSNQDLEKGTGTMLRFQNGPTPTDLIEVPLKRSRAISEGWSKNNCMLGMGYHNFYKSEEFEAHNCLEIRPAFLLYNKAGQLHGFGFAAPGYATSPRFEHPNSRILESLIGKGIAQCVKDTADTVKYTSMHVYFVNHPYLINCWW